VKALVTGGGGFLGKAVVGKLLERGYAVRSLARGDYPELRDWGVETVRGDLADRDAVIRAAEGCELVFHVAAKAGVWGRRESYFISNVTGTENVLAACRVQGIQRLIYTSTPSVVFAGKDIEGGDESLPYPEHYEAPYPETKAIAEQMVLAANGPGLSTVALRPHLIWGPGDTQLIPRIIARARAGTLPQIGRRKNLVDTVYVDNAADAHLLAADRLAPGGACAGRAYFITNGEPLPIVEIMNRIVAAAGCPPISKRIPPWLAVAGGWAAETFNRVFAPDHEPLMTRFLAKELSTAHWFDISAARRDLGYEPAVSITEGIERLRAWFEEEGTGRRP
jgi:nucleoside-diphosphate-sugar epimerase